MRSALLYGSTHGRTRKVVEEILPRLKIRPDVFDLKERPAPSQFAAYDLWFFLAPTYGDEELQEHVEDFLADLDLDLTGKYFVICELGNYYGYDNFSFGAMPIIRRCLLQHQGRELFEPLSLDSFPRLHWGHCFEWVERLNLKLDEFD